jgi:hypothetical protein
MANPGLDGFNLEADDVLSPRRQAEILVLVEALTGFRPTRVLIEAPAEGTGSRERYRAFRDGEREPRRNESEQVGFRLATLLDHDEIHPVDVPMDLPVEPVFSLVEQDPDLQELMGGLQVYGERAMETLAGWLAGGTVGDMLYRMNTPEALAWAHDIYLRYFPPVVANGSYAGPDYLAAWYHRNLRIFGNFHRAVQGPNERLFVLIGQGHVPILRQLVIESPWFCLEDPLPHLEGARGR